MWSVSELMNMTSEERYILTFSSLDDYLASFPLAEGNASVAKVRLFTAAKPYSTGNVQLAIEMTPALAFCPDMLCVWEDDVMEGLFEKLSSFPGLIENLEVSPQNPAMVAGQSSLQGLRLVAMEDEHIDDFVERIMSSIICVSGLWYLKDPSSIVIPVGSALDVTFPLIEVSRGVEVFF